MGRVQTRSKTNRFFTAVRVSASRQIVLESPSGSDLYALNAAISLISPLQGPSEHFCNTANPKTIDFAASSPPLGMLTSAFPLHVNFESF